MGTTGNDEPLKLPAEVRPGQPVRASETNKVRKALQALDGEVRRRTPVASVSHGIRRTGGGFQVFHRRPEREGEKVVGLMPVARGLGTDPVDNPETPGVGMALGHVVLVNATGPAVSLVPTLEGDALDADPPPRKELTAGDWEAWVCVDSSSALVKFVSSGSSAPTDKDWQVRVATFSVTLPAAGETQIPEIVIAAQEVHGEVVVVLGHPFQITVEANGATWDATIAPGLIQSPTVYEDTNGEPVWGGFQAFECAETTLTGLADNTTYGIWLEVTMGGVNTTAALDPSDDQGSQEPSGVYAYSKSSTYTAASQAGTQIAANAAKSFVFVGDVDILAGVVTVGQNLKDHLQWPTMHNTDNTDTP